VASAGPAAALFLLAAGVAGQAARARAAGTGAVPCVPARLNTSAALAGGRLTVSPEPGSRDASAATQISLLGAPVGELGNLVVRGSLSGVHLGRLVGFSQGDGASFLPARPFAEGETVRVTARLAGEGPAAAAVPLAWSFTVATRDVPGAGVGTKPSLTVGRDLHQSFLSRPDLRPPLVSVSPTAAQASGGDLFLAPYSGEGQYGPMILDEHGGLVWFDPLPAGARAADFRVQSYHGQPALTWWQDPLVAGGSSSAGGVIADGSYRRLAVVRAGNGYQADLHEFQLTEKNTAVMTVFDAIRCNLSSIGGPREGAVADTLFQEVDLATGLVRFEWHLLDYLPLSGSYSSARGSTAAAPFDPFHINSVDVARDGSFLVGARNTWAVYDVDPRSGQVRWQLGGKYTSFRLGPGAATAWQHDAREQPDGAITFFDNGASPEVHPGSRAVEVALDPAAGTATLVRSYVHPGPLVSASQGNVQELANGDWMIGWGQAGYFSEVEPSGRLLFDARLPSGWESYRTYVLPWSAHPAQAPSLALRLGSHGGALAYASWNGSTGVAAWRVLGGPSPRAMGPLSGAPRAGFETRIAVPAHRGVRYLAVQALGSQGQVLAGSVALKVPRGY
jgi:hypothetical protein